MSLLRSIIFDILFYSITALLCIALLPCLLLPREAGLNVARFWTFVTHQLEKYVLGLDLEIRGLEHLPKEGAYIVAVKHQSAYETLKLHHLFEDPSIVLKKELYSIPLWGQFLKKIDMIAINRQNREEAMASIVDGAKRMKEQGRPIVIFPQGTRVLPEATTQQKPYKGGIAKMYENTDLPVIPMALNTGLFWRRNAFIKTPGKVIFEFLPPIPSGKERSTFMSELENVLEDKSIALMIEAQKEYPAVGHIEIPQRA
ncbi:MAG: lysophospholipid acyltransferase family protein [Pseudomonadota bacterium]